MNWYLIYFAQIMARVCLAIALYLHIIDDHPQAAYFMGLTIFVQMAANRLADLSNV